MIELPSSGLNLCFDGSLTVACASDLCSWLFGLSEPENKAYVFLIAKLPISVFFYVRKIHDIFILIVC